MEEIAIWLIKLKGGIELTEAQLSCWDRVPLDVEIEKAAMVIDRQGAQPYVIEYCTYEQYCIARLGSAAQGAAGQIVGYSVAVVKGDFVLEHEILPNGMRLKLYPRAECEIPERCFRRGKPICST